MEKGKGTCLNSEVKEGLSENRTFDLGPEEGQKKEHSRQRENMCQSPWIGESLKRVVQMELHK